MTKHSHKYEVTVCPNCGGDLTTYDGVKIEIYRDGEGTSFLPSSLDNTGELMDVNNVVANGLHSDTLCSKCGCPLNDYEAF